MVWIVLLPLRLLGVALVNLLLLPRNLLRALRRRPAWVAVKLAGPLLERRPRRKLLRRPKGVSLEALADLGEEVRRDPRVRGVLLLIDAIDAGWARLESLRAQIAAWRAAGKRVVAHLSSPGNRELFVAAACDEILCDESGSVGLTGLAIEAGFYGEALRRLGVDAEVEAQGEYKSFGETFTRSDMSSANREATAAILDGVDRGFRDALAAGRSVDATRVQALIDGGPYLPEAAREAGLVDAILYRDEVPKRLETGESRIVKLGAYLGGRVRWFWPGLRRRREVALLSLDGIIAPGRGSNLLVSAVGADAACRTLTALRKDDGVAAVVLRVDSRGGSAAASDRIWREVQRLAEKKPVVAHLGDVAASGGYYVVAPCHWIVAQPSTLTGSIGVIGGKLVVERLLERLGIGTELLARGQAAAMASARRRYDEAGREKLRAEIVGMYAQFVAKVMAGRHLDEARTDAAARGRVWTGADARERGLVDQLGGLADAIAEAERRARRRPGEEFRVVDHAPKREGGPLAGLFGDARALHDALATLDSLTSERVLAVALRLPTIR
ncbi:MAG: signal peptide peptidase SppA [Deltaproteobacteria bacterium]|nr:signal peptide peptidase SppA [Deltaproteobacteria bacterium]